MRAKYSMTCRLLRTQPVKAFLKTIEECEALEERRKARAGSGAGADAPDDDGGVACDLANVGLTGSDAVCIWETLRKNPFVTELDVSGNGLTAESMSDLGSALADNDQLACLSIAHNPVGTLGVTALLEATSGASVVDSLDISHTGVRELSPVCEAVKRSPRLQHLWMDGLGFGDDAGRLLGEIAATQKQLLTLSLAGNPLGDDGVQAFCHAVATAKPAGHFQLVELDLSDTAIGPRGATAVAALLRSPAANLSLEYLALADNAIGAYGCKALARAISGDAVVGADASPDLVAIAGPIDEHSTFTPLLLSKLDLSNVDTGVDGANALNTALQKAASSPRRRQAPPTVQRARPGQSARKPQRPTASPHAAEDVKAERMAGTTPNSTSGRDTARRIDAAAAGDASDPTSAQDIRIRDTRESTLSGSDVDEIVDKLLSALHTQDSRIVPVLQQRLARDDDPGAIALRQLRTSMSELQKANEDIMGRLASVESRLASTEDRTLRIEAASSDERRASEETAIKAKAFSESAGKLNARLEEIEEEMRWMDEESAKARVAGEARLSSRLEAIIASMSETEASVEAANESLQPRLVAVEEQLAALAASRKAAVDHPVGETNTHGDKKHEETPHDSHGGASKVRSPARRPGSPHSPAQDGLSKRVIVLERVVAAAGRASAEQSKEQAQRIRDISAAVESAVAFVRDRMEEFSRDEADSEEQLRRSTVDAALARVEEQIEKATRALRRELLQSQECASAAVEVNQQIDYRRLNGRLDALGSQIKEVEHRVQSSNSGQVRSLEQILLDTSAPRDMEVRGESRSSYRRSVDRSRSPSSRSHRHRHRRSSREEARPAVERPIRSDVPLHPSSRTRAELHGR